MDMAMLKSPTLQGWSTGEFVFTQVMAASCVKGYVSEMIILEFVLGSLSLQRSQLHAELSVVQVLHGVGECKLFQRKNGCN